MRLEGRRQSSNVEDRRRSPGPALAAGGGAMAVIVTVIVLLLGGKPEDAQRIVQQLEPAAGAAAAPAGERELTPEEIAQGEEAAKILALTEDVWKPLLARYNVAYREPTMVLFSGAVQSACGHASAATGPFYCPGDAKVYLDTTFFTQLSDRFGSPGDFARAYVIAHEVGHHIQNLLGYTDKVDAQRGRLPEEEMNALSVRLELQADYLAGVFAHHLQGEMRILERGDVEEALRCAMEIGDDRLQRRAQGYVVPESFTHGTSEQRQRWFLRGFETGDLSLLPQFFEAAEL